LNPPRLKHADAQRSALTVSNETPGLTVRVNASIMQQILPEYFLEPISEF
jgi:hypothetical protein